MPAPVIRTRHQNLTSKRIQCDEIWAFCYTKAKNAPADMKATRRAIWTWTALDPDSKLIVSWLVGDRDVRAATRFMNDVAKRLANRIQLTTDGHKAYLVAMDSAFNEKTRNRLRDAG